MSTQSKVNLTATEPAGRILMVRWERSAGPNEFATGEAEYRWRKVGFGQSIGNCGKHLARRAGPPSLCRRTRTKRQSLMHCCPTSSDLNGWPGTVSRCAPCPHCPAHQQDGPVPQQVPFPEHAPRCCGNP